MANASTSDLLGAASLALAGLSIFYSLWSPDIETARNTKAKDHRLSRDPQIEAVQQAARTRAIPLAIAAIIVAVMLAPPVINILLSSATGMARDPGQAIRDYNAVEGLLVVTWLGLTALAGLSWNAVIALWRKANQLRLPDPPAATAPEAWPKTGATSTFAPRVNSAEPATAGRG